MKLGNHIVTNPKITHRMYLTPDGKHVISETTITDKRPVKYYTKRLMPEVFEDSKKPRRRRK